jgi:putative PIN family toxin of toxin-antitoxin system
VRAVIDTNVLLAALLWRGAPHELLGLVRSGQIELISSPALMAELAEVLARPKFDAVLQRSDTDRPALLRQVQELVELLSPAPLPQPVCRDPDDDELLALAVAAGVECIVSGDADLLVLHPFEGVRILTPVQTLELLHGPAQR